MPATPRKCAPPAVQVWSSPPRIAILAMPASSLQFRLSSCPENGVAKDSDESRILKMFRAVSHKDVNVPCFHALVCPDNWMVAHLQAARRRVAVFVDARQHMHIRPR